jgi:hypothetical protein
MTFWNDALRNDYKGTGYIDGGRKYITQWLFESLTSNKPYNQFVRDLVTGENGAAGLHRRHHLARRRQRQPDPRNAGGPEHLAGVHGREHEVRQLPRQFYLRLDAGDSYGLAGIYAETPPEMAQCDKPLGKVAKLKFIYPQLGEIDPEQAEGRAAQAARRT